MITLPLLVFTLAAAPPIDAEARAVAYLAAEVPRWRRENKCSSCHHNADAARALYAARRAGYRVPDAALADTTAWLERPAGWDKNGGEGPFSDKKLARLQFAATLFASGSRDAAARDGAAKLVADLQGADGSWRVVEGDTIGGATTLGTALATRLAVTTLKQADSERFKDALARAARWQSAARVDTVLDAAGLFAAQPARAAGLIRKGESRDGGWGPYVNSPPEVFDTAVVLVALVSADQTPEVRAWLRRGRAFLLSMQQSDGSWLETTRPSGGDSYSQRLSTTGWATLALIRTR